MGQTQVQPRSETFEAWSTAIYGAALFQSAALLFLVQPMFAKEILPLLGGTPAVWNTCVVFYELMLLAGYLYAFALQRWLAPRVQLVVHLVLVLVVLAYVPLRIHALGAPPPSATPVPWLLLTLLFSLGVPLLVLGATSPLLQSWFAATTHRRAADPYFLYAASNAGSMIGLLSYPFLLEPFLGVHSQTLIWSVGYFVLIACLASAGIVLFRGAEKSAAPPVDDAPAHIASRRIVRWILLAFVPSSLMLSVTTYMTTDIAPIPLLWVLPLGLYLLTFVIAFSRGNEWRVRILPKITPFALLLLIVVMAAQVAWPRPLLITIHLATFFLIALTCHSLLVADRPPKRQLTDFYLWLATGGALGGIFTAIIAPLIFTTVVEYPLVLVLAAFFIRDDTARDHEPQGDTLFLDILRPLMLGGVLAICIVLLARFAPQAPPVAVTLAFAAAAIVAGVFFSRPARFALAVGGIFLCSILFAASHETRLYVERNFFGISTVLAFGPYHVLVHGQTIHGVENMLPARRNEPLTYYTRSGPLGQIFSSLGPQVERAPVAVVGLGIGAAMCYRTRGEQWIIYEIDPAVDRIARDTHFFTFIDNCAPSAPTLIGDARLSLDQAVKNRFSLMILDAYSADYIPVHLLTREALQIYSRKLTPHGVMAFHISNQWFDLEPVLGSLAGDASLTCYVEHDANVTAAEASAGKSWSDWAVIARAREDIAALIHDVRWHPCRLSKFPVWTDDYSSLVTTLKVLAH